MIDIHKYVEDDVASSLELVQDIIADETFAYRGNSLHIIEIVNAIKSGWRLANLAEVDRRISDAFNQGFEEGIRACKKED